MVERPEHKIQMEIIKFLKCEDWFVKSTHGNMYQSGFPDLYCAHCDYGARWVEVKLPNMKGSRFTAAQLEVFPMLTAKKIGVWVLTAATRLEYEKLFKPANWWTYVH